MLPNHACFAAHCGCFLVDASLPALRLPLILGLLMKLKQRLLMMQKLLRMQRLLKVCQLHAPSLAASARATVLEAVFMD
jgi:hypothetical protein